MKPAALALLTLSLAATPQEAPFELQKGEKIALVGGSLGERMNLFGHFETLLHSRFPDLQLVVRNFSRPADEVGTRQRPGDYTKIDDPLAVFAPRTMIACFGFCESFAGAAGVPAFKTAYESYLDEMTKKYGVQRFVLVSPIAFEVSGSPDLPDGKAHAANLKLYAQAAAEVAAKRKLPFVDLYSSTEGAFAKDAGLQYTINGVHVNAEGDLLVAQALDRGLFKTTNPARPGSPAYERLRSAVNDKSWVHLQDYRMINGWYVYGGRRTWNTETFPKEYAKIRAMAAVRDRRTWDLAAGRDVPAVPDDAPTGELFVPKTRFGEPRQKYSENAEGGPSILPADVQVTRCEVPPGFELKPFADEKRFPEIANPVQLSFDSKGRLWLSTMPSYPQWKPGDPKPSDKLVILEDTDADGRADKSTVFYDQLHCPTGFEFYDGGVLVIDQPRLLWLKDTNGDDKADVVVHVLDGFATEDTHHTAGAFESSHGGLLHMLEGVAMSTTLETPWGAFRNHGSSGAYVLDPRTWKVRHFVTPGYGNPWCYVFNEWSQGFCGDGTGASQHWDTPLSGQQYRGRKGLKAVFSTEGMRPVVGSDFLVSRHLPDDVQGQFIYACVINMNGIPRWTWSDDGAGYQGVRVRRDPKDPKTAFDLLKSSDKHFRPVDPKIGPDGAVWFGDWANPLIGHMQYSQRDPNRDHVHGRVYRLVHKDRPLLKPVTQFGKPLAELFDQLKEVEWRTRARARREIQSRPAAEALAAAAAWLAKQDPAAKDVDRLRCEVLWTQQSFHQVDAALVKTILACPTADARAAAVRVVADERERFAGALEVLKAAAADAHPRVRTEAIRGLSFFPALDAMTAVIESAKVDDSWLRYTADAALEANVAVWRGAYLKGEVGKGDAGVKAMLDKVLVADKKGAQVVPHLQVLLGKDEKSAEERNKAMQAIADMKGGSADTGKAVFRRTCTACHRVFNEGAEFGPDMAKVATRLPRLKIVESLIDPNAEVDPKYLTTLVQQKNGEVVSGLLVSETPEALVLFDGKEKKTIAKSAIEQRKALKQSSMPEGLAGTLSPLEVLDLVEFLGTLK